jgi:hypothetical protein
LRHVLDVSGAVSFVAKVGVDEIMGVGSVEMTFRAEDIIL